MVNNNNKLNQLSLTLLRVVLGIIFAYHGYVKLFVKGGFTGTSGFFAVIGIPFPAYSALLVSAAEFFGGLLLVIGLLSKWASLVLLVEMIVALLKVHLKAGFFITQNSYGYEYVLLLIAALIVLLVNGPGRISLGKQVFKNKRLH